MSVKEQMNLFSSPDSFALIRDAVADLLSRNMQPSANELLSFLESTFGWAVRYDLPDVIDAMEDDHKYTWAIREYLRSISKSGALFRALRGEGAPDQDVVSTIDALVQQSKRYRDTKAFSEMIDFIALFREYSPYNNMLVKVQNPSCTFYATAKDWQRKFHRNLIEDARPMLILAPMRPVLLVYDLDQTEGESLPVELLKFSQFEGEYKPDWLNKMIENAKSHRIKVDFKKLSSTLSGFATLDRDLSGLWKMRIAIHETLDGPSRLGVLCHELAHIFLGHLGTDKDLWWPSRSNLTRRAVEIEAEAAAYITMSRLGLSGSSAAYVSRYLGKGDLPPSVSIDLITKVSGYLDRMAREKVPVKRPTKEK